MPRYLVRQTWEHSLIVEADTEDDAMEAAAKIPLDDWDTAEGYIEAEEEENTVVYPKDVIRRMLIEMASTMLALSYEVEEGSADVTRVADQLLQKYAPTEED